MNLIIQFIIVISVLILFFILRNSYVSKVNKSIAESRESFFNNKNKFNLDYTHLQESKTKKCFENSNSDMNNSNNNLILTNCNEDNYNQLWLLDSNKKQVMHALTETCLETNKNNLNIDLKPCDSNTNQEYIFNKQFNNLSNNINCIEIDKNTNNISLIPCQNKWQNSKINMVSMEDIKKQNKSRLNSSKKNTIKRIIN
jgi:hypothetical protein